MQSASSATGIKDAAAFEPGAAAREWRAGWLVVLAGFFGNALVSIGSMSAGTFIQPLEEAFGWTRAEFSSGFMAQAIAGIIFAPLIGILIDKRGFRFVAIPGVLLTGAAFSLFATLNGSLVQWLLLWFLLGVISQFIQISVWMAAVASVFQAGRGLAMSIAMCGTGLSTATMPLFANLMIEQHDWRVAYLAMGLGWGLVVSLIAYFALPADRRGRHEKPVVDRTEPVMTIAQALRSPVFAKLLIVSFISLILNMGLIVHLIPVLGADGMPRGTAVQMASAFGVAMMCGKLMFGTALDRFPGRLVAAILWAVVISAYAVLLLAGGSVGLNLIGVVLLGLSTGSLLTVVSYVLLRHFGVGNFGRLMGIMGSAIAIAHAGGPLLWGFVYDRTHSYDLMLTVAIPLLLASIVMILTLGKSSATAGLDPR